MFPVFVPHADFFLQTATEPSVAWALALQTMGHATVHTAEASVIRTIIILAHTATVCVMKDSVALIARTVC